MIKSIMLALFLALTVSVAKADTATVLFDPPTQRSDNSKLLPSEIAGYEVLDIAGTVLQVLPANAISFSEDIPVGTVKRFLLTVDTGGLRSALTPEILLTSVSSPKPPGNITITIIISR